MVKICSQSIERKYFAASLCFAAAALTGLGAIDHGHHMCFALSSDACYAADSLLTTVNIFMGILMLTQAAQQQRATPQKSRR